jgi:nucleoid-associated protein EbfC
MANPFDAMGGMMGGLQAQMRQMQADAERVEVDGSAAGGKVRVRMNGTQEVLAVHIDPAVLGDAELAEDLIRAAMNDAVRRSKEAVQQNLREFATRMGLPPGMLGL